MEKTICPIDVISLNSADGTIRPLRIRISKDTQKEQRGNVVEILHCRKMGRLGGEAVMFLCWVQMNHQRHLMELQYSTASQNWFLVRDCFS